ncbi:heterokaryon incompatibility protein (het-6OR allele) [Fusarium bulbicola]|nr:heterokaryon incompatibility protein (het-6OR allele) [Fusarium bulbicola]
MRGWPPPSCTAQLIKTPDCAKIIDSIHLWIGDDGRSASSRFSTKLKIVCNLTTVSLDEDNKFSAISYLWGEKGKTEPIIVNGVQQFITPSLANALEYAPYHWANAFPERDSRSCRLWADALCINQDDDLEKGHQVQLMKFIYSAAEVVFSCLDIEASQSDIRLAFKTCETLAKAAVERGLVRSAIDIDATIEDKHVQELEWLLRHPLLDENCPVKSQEFSDAEQAMHRMLKLKYWERAWGFPGTGSLEACRRDPSASVY